MSSSAVITISGEAKKVSFSDVDEIIHREEESTEVYNTIQIREGSIVSIQCKTPSTDQNDLIFFIVDISIVEGQLVVIVQDSQDEDDLQYNVPVRSIKHRVTELREAVERLNSQANYFKFDQDVIKFVKEVTGKTPLELRREKQAKTVAAPPTETRKRGREAEVVEENPVKRAKSGDEENEGKQCVEPEFSPKKLQPMEKASCEEKPTDAEKCIEPEFSLKRHQESKESSCDQRLTDFEEAKFIDDQVYSFKNLIGVGFTADGLLLFHILWSTNEKTWEPWMEFKDYTRCIKKMVRRELRDGFEFTKQ